MEEFKAPGKKTSALKMSFANRKLISKDPLRPIKTLAKWLNKIGRNKN